MDNGLIFPYPLTRAHAEPTDTNRTNLPWSLRGSWPGEFGT
jgi:hypothetical protein